MGEATYNDSVQDNTPCIGSSIITRTWSLTDECGNNTTAAQIITLEDTTAPTFTVPFDIVLECALDPNDLNITGDVMDEADDCDTSLGEATFTDVLQDNTPCNGASIITRTWSLTDDCGNNTTAVQTITLQDTDAPFFTQPADITIECDVDPTDLTIVGDVTDETDNCDDTLGQATYTDAVSANDPCICLLYTSPSPRDQRGSRMPSSA